MAASEAAEKAAFSLSYTFSSEQEASTLTLILLENELSFVRDYCTQEKRIEVVLSWDLDLLL